MLALLTLSLAFFPSLDDTVTLKLISEKGMSKVGYYMPVKIDLTSTKPTSITKIPDGLKIPMFGKLDVTADGSTTFHILLDEPDDAPAKLFVDTNGNGDLTDDPATVWTGTKSKDATKPFTQYGGSFRVNLGTAAQPFEVSFGAYRFDKNDPGRAALKDKILYYRDYVTEGEIKLGDKTYRVLLNDNASKGDFRGTALPEAFSDKDSSGVLMLIDVNANGKFDKRGESFDIRKPFNIGGTTYEVSDMARNGLTFKLIKSTKTVPEVSLAPDHTVGKPVTAFAAKGMDGQPVKFPGDYKGKIVMIDFWATWCGPCMGEVPGLVEAYGKFHDKGFEVLGISLDKENTEEKIKKVTGDNKMTWRQVYDGKWWQAEIAQLYTIDSIPATFLVDGDTGTIIATGGELRGAALVPTLEKALAKKAGK